MIINLTPHMINVYSITSCEEQVKGTYKSLILKDGAVPVMSLPSSGVARASATKELVDTLEGVPLYQTTYGTVENLPEPTEGIFYIVSALTAQAAKNRNDVLIVDGTVRNSEGQIIGCTAFGRV